MAKKYFKPASDLAEITAESREHIAKKLFDYEAIRHQITEYAAAGRVRLRVSQEEALDLSHTKVVEALCAKLEKQGYGVSWSQISKKVTYDNGTHEVICYEELVIAWGSQHREVYLCNGEI